MKLLGMSSSKIASVVFLLMTLLIALVLSSFEFLKTNNMAEVPVFKEGHEGIDSMAGEEPPIVPPPTSEQPPVGDEAEEEKVEGFEVDNMRRQYTSLSEAFGMTREYASAMEGFSDRAKHKKEPFSEGADKTKKKPEGFSEGADKMKKKPEGFSEGAAIHKKTTPK